MSERKKKTTEHADTETKTNQNETNEQPKKGFRIVDEANGTFVLWDRFHGCEREWRIVDESTPGSAMLEDMIEDSIESIQKSLPANISEMSKEDRKRAMSDYLNGLSPDDRHKYINSIKRNSRKRLMVLSSYVEPVDGIPDIWETKTEFLASCLFNDGDAGLINAFFLIRLSGVTISRGE